MDISEFKDIVQKSNKIQGIELIELSELPYLFIKEDLIEDINEIDSATEESFIKSLAHIIHKVIQANGHDISLKKIESTSADVILSVFYWIYDQLNVLLELEKTNLQSIPDPVMLQAGIHRLNPLGEMVTLMNLTKDDYKKAKELGQMAYHEIHWLMVYQNIKSDIEKKANQIVAKK